MPLLALVGISTAMGLAIYFEVAAAGFALLAFLLLGHVLLKRRQARTCHTGCACNDR